MGGTNRSACLGIMAEHKSACFCHDAMPPSLKGRTVGDLIWWWENQVVMSIGSDNLFE